MHCTGGHCGGLCAEASAPDASLPSFWATQTWAKCSPVPTPRPFPMASSSRLFIASLDTGLRALQSKWDEVGIQRRACAEPAVTDQACTGWLGGPRPAQRLSGRKVPSSSPASQEPLCRLGIQNHAVGSRARIVIASPRLPPVFRLVPSTSWENTNTPGGKEASGPELAAL